MTLPVQAVVPNHIRLPVDGAELEHADLDSAEIPGARGSERQRDDETCAAYRDVPCSDHLRRARSPAPPPIASPRRRARVLTAPLT